ncbi:MAG: hypothetical protein HRT65_06620 [Flavobacteriaceae bacterium]|nr:hypothetical protein [Flavobacteriaceae bacterium]
MIATQRRAHRWIWVGLSLVIMLLLVQIIPRLDYARTDAVHTDKTENIQFFRGEGHIELQLNTPLKGASAVVYGLSPKGKSVLGQLQGAKSYRFKIDDSVTGILIVDELRNNELFKTEF